MDLGVFNHRERVEFEFGFDAQAVGAAPLSLSVPSCLDARDREGERDTAGSPIWSLDPLVCIPFSASLMTNAVCVLAFIRSPGSLLSRSPPSTVSTFCCLSSPTYREGRRENFRISGGVS